MDEVTFSKLMKEKKVPVRFKFPMGKAEHKGASFNVDGKNPGIGKSGYKLAHVIDAGKNYCLEGKSLGMTEIIERYFPLGDDKDWNQISADKKLYREIKIEDTKTARKYAEMSFLRMVHPMNYFLSPKAPYKGKVFNYYKFKDSNVYEYDIGEEKKLISYVCKKFHERYKDENGKDLFQEFLNLVGAKEENDENIDKDCAVDIVFSLLPIEAKMAPKQKDFEDFLKNKKKKGTKQLVGYWPKKIKNDTGIDIYDIKDSMEANKELIKFKKGSKKNNTIDGLYYKYNKEKKMQPGWVIKKYAEYLAEKEKNNTESTC